VKKIILTLAILALASSSLYAQLSPPPRRDAKEIKKILAKAKAKALKGSNEKVNILLVARDTTYAPLLHEYLNWQDAWANLLMDNPADSARANTYKPTVESGEPIVTVKKVYAWPKEEEFKAADTIVFFCYVDWNKERFDRLEKYVKDGGGLVILHNTVWTVDDRLSDIIGLSFIFEKSKWLDTKMRLDCKKPDDGICLGMPKEIYFNDEAYFEGKGDLSKLDVLYSWDYKDKDDKTISAPMIWKYKLGKGRVFVNMIGNYMWTFDDPIFRIPTLRGIAWTAKTNLYRFDGRVLKDSWTK